MRDPNRIKPFLNKLEELWERNSDLRFGQIIYLLADEIGRDIFFPEEKEWLDCIQKSINKGNVYKEKI